MADQKLNSYIFEKNRFPSTLTPSLLTTIGLEQRSICLNSSGVAPTDSRCLMTSGSLYIWVTSPHHPPPEGGTDPVPYLLNK